MYRPKTFDPPWIDFFTSPCPYYINHYTKFTLFPKLPRELQLMIWSFVDTEPQRMGVILADAEGDIIEYDHWAANDPYIPTQYNPPALLQTCYDSRIEALKTYRVAFAAQLERPYYFNFHKDTLHFTSLATVRGFINKTPQFGVSPKDMNSVRHLALYLDRRMRVGDVLTEAANICKYFGGLEHLRFIYHPADYVRDDSFNPLPITIRPETNPNFWRFKEWIVSPIEGGRGRLEDWQPPEFQMGTPAQFADDVTRGEPMEWSYNVVLPSFGFTPLYESVDLGGGTPAAVRGPLRMCWVERSMSSKRRRVG
jgi:hypothetical protein